VRIECVGIDTAFLERGQHRVAAHQRHLALGRVAAEQHGHLAELAGELGAMNGGLSNQQAHAGVSGVHFNVEFEALM
jgi:hypothetical protein